MTTALLLHIPLLCGVYMLSDCKCYCCRDNMAIADCISLWTPFLLCIPNKRALQVRQSDHTVTADFIMISLLLWSVATATAAEIKFIAYCIAIVYWECHWRYRYHCYCRFYSDYITTAEPGFKIKLWKQMRRERNAKHCGWGVQIDMRLYTLVATQMHQTGY